MAKKYIKCPRCELNYILEGEDYCHVCKSEMKHHTENDDDELLDLEDMELCPVCGQNYIKENETMCSECRGKSKGEDSDSDDSENSDSKGWKADGDDDLTVSASSDIESDEEYNSGFSDIDPELEEDDPYKTDGLDADDETGAIDFAGEDEEPEENFDDEETTLADDFETVDISDDDIDDEDDEEDDDFDFDDDLLGKKK